MKGLLLSFILLFWGTFSVNAQNRSIRFLWMTIGILF